jgi:LysM repeat protein
MIGDSLNLVNLIRGYIPEGFADKAASLLGESREKTQLGMNASVPAILSGITGAASTTDGARRVTDAVDNADEGILSNMSGLLGKMTSGEGGFGMLRSILGAGALSELTGNIGRMSGLSGKGTGSLLGMVAPIIFGVLKNVKRTKGLDSSGFLNLLSSQKDNFAAALPQGTADRVVSEPASYIKEPAREPLRDVSYQQPGRESIRERAVRTGQPGSRSWGFPLLILLGLLGLLWWWGSRPSSRAAYDGTRATEQASRPEAGYNRGAASSLDALKTKYQSVIDRAREQGIQLSNLEEQNGKLIIKGTAPSMDAANSVWNEIKRVNPSMNDIVADFPVSPSLGQIPGSETTADQTATNAPETSNARENIPGSPDATPGADMTGRSKPSEPSDQAAEQGQEKSNLPVDSATEGRQKPGEPSGQAAEQGQEKSNLPVDSDSEQGRLKPGGRSDSSSSELGSETYVVKSGDTLGTISKQFYGSARDYKRILNANKDLLNNPDRLEVGQELTIPAK